jgi:transcriptional regulator with XRE-family HTH domain
MPSPPEVLQGFSQRLALLIQREGGRGKKQAFARKIGVKPQQLSRYQKGQIPDAPTLLAIAEVGQVDVDWLLTGREPGEAAAQANQHSLHQALLRRFAQLPLPVVLMLLRVLDELEAPGILDQWP